MCCQSAFPGKALVAGLALKRLVTGVDALMSCQMAFLGKALVAGLALEGAILAVPPWGFYLPP